MSETAEAVSENTETPQETTQEIGQQQDSTNDNKPTKPAGYYPIDFKTAAPEEIEQRFDYVYRQVKQSERERQEWKKIDSERQRVILELQEGVGQVVNHLTQKSFSDNESQLQTQMQKALETGDTQNYLAAQNKLIDLKTQQRLAERKPEKQPERAVEKPQQNYEDDPYASSWMNERGENGHNLRPWAFNSSDDPENPDPDYIKAAVIAKNVFNNMPHLTIQQKLAEVDKRMGLQRNGVAQNVMGANLTKGGKSAKVELTNKQREIAVRTKFAGPKASEADHVEAFRKAILKQRGQK